MSANLNITEWVEGQAHPEVTHNDAVASIDAAITEQFTVDMTAGDVTLTSTQFRKNIKFFGTNVTVAGRDIIVPAIKRMFFVEANSTNTQPFNVTCGSTSIALVAGNVGVFFTDGTTNGLKGKIVGGATNPVPNGGTTAQVLAKASNADGDFAWSTTHYPPAAGATGQVLVKNSSSDYDYSWVSSSGGGGAVAGGSGDGGAYNTPVIATFGTTQDNVTSSNALSATDVTNVGFRLSKSNTATGNTNRWGIRLKSIPTAPATMEAVIRREHRFDNWHGCGMILRESATGKVVNFGFTNDGGHWTVGVWTSNGDSFSFNRFATVDMDKEARIRIRLTTTPRIFWEQSWDGGSNWIEMWNEAPTASFTTAPDQVGFGVNANALVGPHPTAMTVRHYLES